MNNYETKLVPFMGSELMAAKDNDGQVWVGVSYICRGIGLSKNEKDRQIKNVQADTVLKRGCVKFDAGVFDPNNETVALKLDYLPLWLAKISITPTMERETPEVAERLIQYQLKAKDVLAAAFLPGQSNQQTANPTLSPETALSLIKDFSAAQTNQERLLIVGMARTFGVDKRTMDLLESQLLSEAPAAPAPPSPESKTLTVIVPKSYQKLFMRIAEIGERDNSGPVPYIKISFDAVKKEARKLKINGNEFISWMSYNGFFDYEEGKGHRVDSVFDPRGQNYKHYMYLIAKRVIEAGFTEVAP